MRLLSETESRRILLVAPAGYGKTTLARQWLAEGGRTGVWYRANTAATDVAALAVSIAKVAEGVVQGAGERLQDRLRQSPSPKSEADQLGAILAEDLQDWPNDRWLVIDDYHFLSNAPEAERFIDAFLSGSRVPMVVTSRTRPAWATARRFLYGEIAEFGRNVLAMTHEEAARALPPDRHPQALAGLVALAEGWPAVMGLASLVQSPMTVGAVEMPAALHSYFAEELYQGLSSELQWNLAQLSLAPTIDLQLVTALFENRGREILERGYDHGFVNRDGDSYDLHPLLRQFLRSKLADAESSAVRSTVETLASLSLQRGAWDDAFVLVSEFALRDLLADLMARALDELLTEGRIATLEQWLGVTQDLIPQAEIFALAEVELAFRKGRWPEAEHKARELSKRLPRRDPLASRALFRAAQVAQLDDRHDEALALLNEARARSTTNADLRRIVWTRFITLTDLEDSERAAAALQEFAALEPETVEDVIRLSQGPVHYSMRWGGIREELERHRATLDRLNDNIDPVVRSGFLQSYGTALNLAARYEEASRLAEKQIAYARRYGLDWVRPHALELEALAQIGMRNFDRAESGLRNAHRVAEQAQDVHAQLNATALTSRIHLAQGEPALALQLLEATRQRAAFPGMEGELRSLTGLALACLGRLDEAKSEIDASLAITNHLEARGLRAYATAVIAYGLDEHEVFFTSLQTALKESCSSGNADAFVTAYRAFPPLVSALADQITKLDDFLLRPIRTYDPRLAEEAGLITKDLRPPSPDGLTEREQEVLALLRQGLSNQEIARALWIAESTAKVHVRHIFDKLGVRSRTAAALFERED